MNNQDKKIPCWQFIKDGIFDRRISLKTRQIFQPNGEQFKQSQDESQNRIVQLGEAQTFLKLQMRSHDVKYDLINNLQEHYRHMAGQALAINLWTSRLIAEEGCYPNNLPEIYKVSQESNTILRLFLAGYPMKHQEKPVDILQSVNEVKDIFLPTLTECNIIVAIKSQLESQLSLDETILKVILYNIFYIISKRMRNNGTLTIELKGQDNARLIFQDDGCDLDINQSPHDKSKDILFMGAKKLQDFIAYLGWEIDFQYPQKRANIIILTIVPTRKIEYYPKNIVPLFNRPNRFGGN